MWTFEYTVEMKADDREVSPEIFKYESTAPPIDEVWKRADDFAALGGCVVASLRLKIHVDGVLFIDIEEPRERKLPTHQEAIEYLARTWAKAATT